MEIFRNQEQAYFEWIASNKDGYVLNARKSPYKSYLVLHNATCAHINGHAINQADNAFTGREFIKVCALDLEEIKIWISKISASEFSKICSTCNPSVESINFDTQSLDTIDNDASPHPRAYLSQMLVFRRDRKVVDATLKRALGVCERCGHPAPFVRRSDGEPFLEVHHTIPLSEGGIDRIENTEALCPNCHREAHFG